MPTPFPPGARKAFDKEWARRLRIRMRRKPRKGSGLEGGGVPVEPDRPNTLSGGAAAALEFDD